MDDFLQASTQCMNCCEIKGTFESNHKKEHILFTPLLPRLPKNFQQNKYLKNLPAVAQPKKMITKKKSYEKKQASKTVKSVWERKRTESSSSYSDSSSEDEVVKAMPSRVAC